MPMLLFKRADLVITEPDDDQEEPSIVWRTSAADALGNLQASGFGWEHLLSDYAQSRHFSMEVAFRQGALMARLSPDAYSALVAKLDDHSPADDLRLLVRQGLDEAIALSAAWSANPLAPNPPSPVRDLLFFNDGEEYHHIDVGDHPQDVQLILTRAAEYLLRSCRSAPLVGWAFTFVAVLKHTPPDAVVEFDISGGFDSTSESFSEYSEQFWESALSDLAETARFYGSIFTSLASSTNDIAASARYGQLDAMLLAASESASSNATRGRRLEELVAALLELPGSGLAVLEKRLKHVDEELDLVLRNDLAEPFWRNFNSPTFLVECKNWSSRVDINELRILETKMRDRIRMCSVGIFVSLNGFSQPFLTRARELQGQGLTIFPVGGPDIREIITTRCTLPQWLSDTGIRRIL